MHVCIGRASHGREKLPRRWVWRGPIRRQGNAVGFVESMLSQIIGFRSGLLRSTSVGEAQMIAGSES